MPDASSSTISSRVSNFNVSVLPSLAKRLVARELSLIPSLSVSKEIEERSGAFVSIRTVSFWSFSSLGFGIEDALSAAEYSFPDGSKIFTVNPRSDSNSEKFVSFVGSMFMTAFQWSPLWRDSSVSESTGTLSLETVALNTLSLLALNSTMGFSKELVTVSSTPAILSVVLK